MKQRTRSRELALQVLYQVDLLGSEILEDLDRRLGEMESAQGARDFAKHLVLGTQRERLRLDEEIAAVAQNWNISRMAVVDRNVLRLAAYEILCCDDIPPKVSINEAIELGKRFSTAQSGSFINGVLDRIKDRAPKRESKDSAAAREAKDRELKDSEAKNSGAERPETLGTEP